MSAAALPFQITLASEADTARLAACIAPILDAGDTLLLEGDVGVGKSAFCRALIHATLAQDGLPAEDVPSPTFTLVQTYLTGRHEIWHADLYRLTHADEVLELGLGEAFDAAVCLVEWPERLGADRPATAATIHLRTTGESTRHLTISGGALATRLAQAAASCLMTDPAT